MLCTMRPDRTADCALAHIHTRNDRWVGGRPLDRGFTSRCVGPGLAVRCSHARGCPMVDGAAGRGADVGAEHDARFVDMSGARRCGGRPTATGDPTPQRRLSRAGCAAGGIAITGVSPGAIGEGGLFGFLASRLPCWRLDMIDSSVAAQAGPSDTAPYPRRRCGAGRWAGARKTAPSADRLPSNPSGSMRHT